jgi:hypothetical protein
MGMKKTANSLASTLQKLKNPPTMMERNLLGVLML